MIEQVDLNDPESKIVLKIGGFHTMMSFLGAIGHLMDGSGLSDLLSLIYATDKVPHLLSGKAISRAIRGHLLVDSALHALLLSQLFTRGPLPKEPDHIDWKSLFDSLLSPISSQEIEWKSSPALERLMESYQSLRLSLSESE